MNRLSFLGKRGNLVHVTTAGQGKPLVLLHGFPLDHRQWMAQLESLSADYHVIAPDLRGFGRSALNEPDYSMADLADDVEQVRMHLVASGPIALCGLSMGGYVALEYWRGHSDRLSALILANTKPDADSEPARASRQEMINQARQHGSWQAVSGMLPKLLTDVHRNVPGPILSCVEQMMRECSVEAVVAAQQAMSHRADFIPLLPTLQVPTLVITGEHDPIAPPEATRKWAAVLPHSHCHVIPDAAHLTPLEVPATFNRLVSQFLAE